MKKFLLLFLGILCSLGIAWADNTYNLTNATQEDGTYTWTFENAVAAKNVMVYVEVPSATSTGKVAFSGGTTKDDRFLYIYKTNGTAKDEGRVINMTKNVYSEISYTASDIKTDNKKYYLVFSTTDDYKYNGIKLTPLYTVTCNEATNGTVSTNCPSLEKVEWIYT